MDCIRNQFWRQELEPEDISESTLTSIQMTKALRKKQRRKRNKLRLRNVPDELVISHCSLERRENEPHVKTYAAEDGAKRAGAMAAGARRSNVDIAVKINNKPAAGQDEISRLRPRLSRKDGGRSECIVSLSKQQIGCI